MLSGVRPACPSSLDSAIEKQPAWAAAISSSGLVPFPCSKRVVKEYWVSDRTPLSVEMAPLPSLRPPFQTADALRFMVGTPGYLGPLRATRGRSAGGRTAPLGRLCLLLVLRHHGFRQAIGHR